MKRRGFIGCVLGLTGIAGANPVCKTAPAQEPEKQSGFHYRGWWIIWSGWLPKAEQDGLWGRWEARPYNRHICLYSAIPGGCAEFHPGDCFQLGLRPDQPQPSIATPRAELEVQKKAALEKLLRLIDARENRSAAATAWDCISKEGR